MAEDFERHCPDTKVTLLQDKADYTVILNHIELGLLCRDNQLEVADKNGDLLMTREKGGIKGGVTGVCAAILSELERFPSARSRRYERQFARGWSDTTRTNTTGSAYNAKVETPNPRAETPAQANWWVNTRTLKPQRSAANSTPTASIWRPATQA